MNALRLTPVFLLAFAAALLLTRIALNAALPLSDVSDGRPSEYTQQNALNRPSADCLQREALQQSPCSEAEYERELQSWREYYGCDRQGCGAIDFAAQADPTAAVVLEPSK